MRGAEQDIEDEEAGSSLLSVPFILETLQRRWRWIVGCAVVVTLLAILLALVLPNRFEAAATVQVDPRKKSISNIEGVLSDLKGDQPTIESQIELIRSRSITLKVIELLDLRKDTEFTAPGFSQRALSWVGLGKQKTASPTRKLQPEPMAELSAGLRPGILQPERDEVAVAFDERLKVRRVRNTLLIEIQFAAKDPVKAARIANTIAEVYVKDQLDTKVNAASYATSQMERQLEEMRTKLAQAEGKVEEFKSSHNIYDLEGHILSERELARLMEQTVLARNATAEARARYEQAQQMIARGEMKSAVANVLQSDTVRRLKEELAKLTRRAAELSTRYGPKHPEILKVNAEIGDAKGQLTAEVDKLVASLKNDYESADNRQRQLDKALTGFKDQQAGTKNAAVVLKQLERDAQTSRQLFEAMLARYKQTAETQSLQLPDARIVERADVPLLRSAPNRKRIALLGVVGGIFAGIMLAIAVELMVPVVARGADVQRTLSIEHLASIPEIGEAPDRQMTVRLMLSEPQSLFAEAIRSLRHEIDARRPNQEARVLMMASSLANEGRSEIASNLAHHYALTGARTLLVDFDLRKAELTSILMGGAPGMGLSEVLEYRQAPESAVVCDQTTGLCFMPACGHGHLQALPAELLASALVPALLERLRQHFDIIILDCPPILPVVDTRVLAAHVDQIAFVMTSRRTPKTLARRALAALGPNERKVVGVVLNEVEEADLGDLVEYGRAYAPLMAA